MLDSIFVGMTGLLGYSRGLRVIANNTANINTPGFKSSTQQFSDLFYAGTGSSGGLGQGSGQLGYGLNASSTTLSMKQGDLRQTGNDLDLAIDGQGLFTLKNDAGDITYTRAGQFKFNADGVLVTQSGAKVMGVDSKGHLSEITLSNQRVGVGKGTSTIKFSGNLSSTATSQSVNPIQIFNNSGGEQSLSVNLTNTGDTKAGSWRVDLLDGTKVVGTGEIVFKDGAPLSTNSKVNITYTPAGSTAQAITLDFSADVTSFAAGTLSTIAVSSQDGFAAGALTKATFDAAGTLVLSYSNGQTVKGSRLSLGRVDSMDALDAVGDNEFEARDGRAWHIGTAGDGPFGKVRAGVVEISNVDLSQQFSDLVVMQRGYQASSQIISTANDMLQQLFAMHSK